MHRHVLLGLGLCVLLARLGWTQDPPAPTPNVPQPKSSAEGVVHYAPAEDRPIVMTLLESAPLEQRAIRDVANQMLKDASAELPHVTIAIPPTGLPASAGIIVQSYDERISADKVLERYVDLVRNEWAAIAAPSELAQRTYSVQGEVVQKLKEELATERNKLAALAMHHGVDLDPEVAVQKRLQVETERQRLVVEHEGLIARKAVLQAQIVQAAQKAEQAAAATTPIAVELLKSVEALKKVLDYRRSQLQVGATDATAESVEQAKVELAKAQLELARHRLAVATSAGKDRIDQLQRRLDDTEIELTENQARSAALDKLAASLAYFRQVDDQRRAVEFKEQELNAAQQELSRIKTQLTRYRPPQLTLIRTK
jgi:chromosome segregation ATPase